MEALPDKILQILNSIQSNSTIVVNDTNLLTEKLLLISNGGKENLCVITDYDATLTKFWVKPGVKFVGGHNVPLTTNLVSEEFKAQIRKLASHYLPFETDLQTSMEVKEAKLLQWFNEVHNLFLVEGFSLKKIQDIVALFHTDFRDLVDTFFNLTENLQIPVIVLSADIIEATFKKYGLDRKNVTVVSNEMIFSEEQPCNANKFGPVIHVFNKGRLQLDYFPKAHHCNGKQNGIVIGDALGDSNMGDSFNIANVLKIGIINHGPTKELLQVYLENFDVVMLGNPDFSLVNQIVNLTY